MHAGHVPTRGLRYDPPIYFREPCRQKKIFTGTAEQKHPSPRIEWSCYAPRCMEGRNLYIDKYIPVLVFYKTNQNVKTQSDNHPFQFWLI